jgi:hypothetical protein
MHKSRGKGGRCLGWMPLSSASGPGYACWLSSPPLPPLAIPHCSCLATVLRPRLLGTVAALGSRCRLRTAPMPPRFSCGPFEGKDGNDGEEQHKARFLAPLPSRGSREQDLGELLHWRCFEMSVWQGFGRSQCRSRSKSLAQGDLSMAPLPGWGDAWKPRNKTGQLAQPRRGSAWLIVAHLRARTGAACVYPNEGNRGSIAPWGFKPPTHELIQGYAIPSFVSWVGFILYPCLFLIHNISFFPKKNIYNVRYFCKMYDTLP